MLAQYAIRRQLALRMLARTPHIGILNENRLFHSSVPSRDIFSGLVGFSFPFVGMYVAGKIIKKSCVGKTTGSVINEVYDFVSDRLDIIKQIEERCYDTLIKAGISPEEDKLSDLYRKANYATYGRHFGDRRIQISSDGIYGALIILKEQGVSYAEISHVMKEKMIEKEKNTNSQNKRL